MARTTTNTPNTLVVRKTGLALELAAARMRVLSLTDLLRRLEDSSPRLLRSAARDAPERHRSLHATLEWTYGALTKEQRLVFRRLGAFAGPVPLDAIEAATEQLAADSEPLDTLDALEGLIDFSLVHRDQSPDHGLRFTMPQALRDYAREKLATAGEKDMVNRRHAEHVNDVAALSRVWVVASAMERARAIALDAELTPALEWAANHDTDLHRRLVADLGSMLTCRGRVREVDEHLARALEGRTEPANPLDAWLGTLQASALMFAGLLPNARVRIQPGITFAREHNDVPLLAVALDFSAYVHFELGEIGVAVAAAEESLELLRRAGERRLLPYALVTFAQALIYDRRLGEAEQLLDEAASHAEELTEIGVAIATMRADVALGRGDHRQALVRYATSVTLAAQAGDWPQVVNDALSVVSLLSLGGHTETALEADELVAAIARDTGCKTTNTVIMYNDALAKALAVTRAAAVAEGADAVRRAEAIPASERVSRIVALARAEHSQLGSGGVTD